MRRKMEQGKGDNKEVRKRFIAEIYRLIPEIPKGRVASYGQLAILAGGPRWARLAGKALSNAPPGLPCHRVVAGSGRLAPGWAGQRGLLEKEGVGFRANGMVNMKKYRWRV